MIISFDKELVHVPSQDTLGVICLMMKIVLVDPDLVKKMFVGLFLCKPSRVCGSEM